MRTKRHFSEAEGKRFKTYLLLVIRILVLKLFGIVTAPEKAKFGEKLEKM